MTAPRVVVVHRQTEYDALVARHSTRGQAEFFLAGRGQDLGAVEAVHRTIQDALATVSRQIPADWRRGLVDRSDLPAFLFTPDDIVVVVGQDGMVANVAKYLHGQPVIGVNPGATVNAGVLCRNPAGALESILRGLSGDSPGSSGGGEHRTMVSLEADDGQRLLALNDIFVGHRSHQTARYRLGFGGRDEPQASSGVVIGTGTGATGWCRSLSLERHSQLALPGPDERALAFFVREAWPSAWSGTDLTEGRLDVGDALEVEVESDSLIAFGDGIEADRLEITRGQRLRVSVAQRTLWLL